MTTHRLVEALAEAGVAFAASLPDSWLAGVLEALDASETIQHIPVTREDEGVGLVAGMTLAGRRGVVVCQNAGLLVSVDALAGYGSYHGLAVPVIAALRGGPHDGFYYGEVAPLLRRLEKAVSELPLDFRRSCCW